MEEREKQLPDLALNLISQHFKEQMEVFADKNGNNRNTCEVCCATEKKYRIILANIGSHHSKLDNLLEPDQRWNKMKKWMQKHEKKKKIELLVFDPPS